MCRSLVIQGMRRDNFEQEVNVGKNEYLSTVLVPTPLKRTTSYPQPLSILNKPFRVIHNLPTPVNNVVWEMLWG
jgi:hypothetical protein